MKKYFTLGALALGCAATAFGWGQKGHDVTAYIAQQHLTPATATAVDTLLEGNTLVYWANWMDNASNTREYAHTKTWHYKNIDRDVRYDEAKPNPAGDAVTAIKQQMETLANPSASRDDKAVALKFLVHLGGDIHCPMHVGHASDRGGNNVQLVFFDNPANLHSLWDSAIPEAAHKWSYTEWQQNLDRLAPEKQEEVIAGDIDTWAEETMYMAAQMYNMFPKGDKLGYEAVNFCTPIAEKQMLYGGLRLAHMLNKAFDPEYRAKYPDNNEEE